MVKLFIGNLANNTTVEEVRGLFEKYGTVRECDIFKNFGFVHMSSMAEAEEAIRNLHQMKLNGWNMNVELSKGRKEPRASTKLHVTNLSKEVTTEQLWAMFGEFGPVVECDIVKNYAFVHMERMEDASEAISKLDNKAFQGKVMKVQLSTSRLRTAPGMGDNKSCYVCGKNGHWWKKCPVDRDGDGARSRSGQIPPHSMASPPAADYTRSSVYSQAGYSGYTTLPPPPPSFSSYGSDQGGWYASSAAGSYTDQSAVYGCDHLYSGVDYYQKYTTQSYGSSQVEGCSMSYIPPPPPPTSVSSSTDPYNHQPLASSSSAAVYYSQECSPVTQAPSSSTAYTFEQKRLSPAAASGSSYPALRPKDPYAQRYAPY